MTTLHTGPSFGRSPAPPLRSDKPMASDFLAKLMTGLDAKTQLLIDRAASERQGRSPSGDIADDIRTIQVILLVAMNDGALKATAEAIIVLDSLPGRIEAEREKARKDLRSAVISERLACAKLADDWKGTRFPQHHQPDAAARIAAEIRARSLSERPVDPAEVQHRS